MWTNFCLQTGEHIIGENESLIAAAIKEYKQKSRFKERLARSRLKGSKIVMCKDRESLSENGRPLLQIKLVVFLLGLFSLYP